MKNILRPGVFSLLSALLICPSADAVADSLAASEAKIIELILDASGSMNAKLPGAGSRIEAARTAVEQVVAALSPDTQLAFRVYGHQSPREKPRSAGKDSMESTTYVTTRFDVIAAPVNIGLLTGRPQRADGLTQQLFHLIGERSGSGES